MSEIIKLLEQISPPVCFFVCREKSGDIAETGTIFIIKEEKSYIDAIPQEIAIDFRTGMIAMNKIAVIIVLFRLGKSIYECYFNYKADLGKSAIEYLTKQDFIFFEIYNEQCKKERYIMTANKLKEFFKENIYQVEQLQTWSEFEFNQAKNKICNSMDLNNLWNSLGGVT